MLACDIIVQARAARRLSAGDVARLERLVFADGVPTREAIEALLLIDSYVEAGDHRWSALLARAASAFDASGPRHLASAA
jgi:hypothetical protein